MELLSNGLKQTASRQFACGHVRECDFFHSVQMPLNYRAMGHRQSDVDDDVAVVIANFPVWAAAATHDRALVSRKAMDLLEAYAAPITLPTHLEQGKSIAEAEAETRYFAGVSRLNAGRAGGVAAQADRP